MLRILGLFSVLLLSAASAHAGHAPSAVELFQASAKGDPANVVRELERGVDVNTVHHEKTAIIELLNGWHRHVDFLWPQTNTAPFEETLKVLLDNGADACLLCPTMDAVLFRNMKALRMLLGAMKSSKLRECLEYEDSNGATLMHHMSKSMGAGLARMVLRANREFVPEPVSGRPLRVTRDHIAALEAELSLRIPHLGAGRSVRKRDIEAGYAPVEAQAIRDAVSTLHDSKVEEDLVQIRDSRDMTPLLVACESGRADMLPFLFSMAGQQLGNMSSLRGGSRSAGLTCAHYAATKGYAHVLKAYAEQVQPASLSLLDDRGRSACDVGRLMGETSREVVAILQSHGACSADVQLAGAGTASPSRPGPVLRSFNPLMHVLAGWRLASPLQLEELGLWPDLFSPSHVDRNITSVAEREGREGAFPCACGVDVLPSSILAGEQGKDDSGARRLYADYIAIGKPFLIAGVYDPEQALASAESMPASVRPLGPPMRSSVPGLPASSLAPIRPGSFKPVTYPDLLAKLGGLPVESGAIPYSSSYGVASNKTRLGEFMRMYMGHSVRSGLLRGMIKIMHNSQGRTVSVEQETESVGVATDGKSGAAMGSGRVSSHGASFRLPASSWSGPGSNLTQPPYVFDGAQIRSRPQLFSGFSLHPVFEKGDAILRQLIVGPPLSGAMPHFHGPAVNVLLTGVKLWFLFPPAHAAFADAHVRSWYDASYVPLYKDKGGPGAGGQCEARGDADTVPTRVPHLVFVQEPGDLVYVPLHWGHAVLNLADTVAIAYE